MTPHKYQEIFLPSKKLYWYVPEVAIALWKQLRSDDARYHTEWLKRGRDGQEERAYAWFAGKMLEFRSQGKPFPWLKMIGEGLIGYVREKYL